MDNGKKYLINHERKGQFTVLVESQDDTWIRCVIVAGTAGAYLEYNIRDAGENITLRKAHIRSFKEAE